MTQPERTEPRVRRWRIEGRLTTTTPLHLGTGGFEQDPNLTRDREDVSPEVKAIVLDCNGRPCLTPTGLKGAMQAWGRNHLPSLFRIRQSEPLLDGDILFGASSDPEGEARGGRLELHYARLDPAALPMAKANNPVPFADDKRHSQIETGVRINRASGTALDRHLFFKEVVAPKATFGVIMDLDVPPDSTDDGRSLVSATLTLLSAFAMEESSDLPPLTLGAMTGRGFGRFEWTLTAVRRATDTSVKRWLNDGAKGAWDQALEPLPDPEKKAFEQDAAKLRGQGRAGAELVCDVDLAFDFRFLVSEPGRVVTQAQAGNNGKATASIMPKVDREGHAVLPTASIKGVLRSRAERIWATLTTDESPFGHAPGRGPKRLEDPSTQMMAQGLPTERLFGAASWRAALQIDPFTFDEKAGSRPSTQELVAVDRFTGGASGSAKYAIDAFDRPRFSGRLRLDLRRTNDEDLGLLVLLLRDLAEGDLTFGHGATKGYGGAKAAITLRVQGDLSGTPLAGCSLAEGEGLSWGAIADSPLHDPLVKAVEAARGRARDEKAIFQKSEAEKQNRPQQQESA